MKWPKLTPQVRPDITPHLRSTIYILGDPLTNAEGETGRDGPQTAKREPSRCTGLTVCDTVTLIESEPAQNWSWGDRRAEFLSLAEAGWLISTDPEWLWSRLDRRDD